MVDWCSFMEFWFSKRVTLGRCYRGNSIIFLEYRPKKIFKTLIS